MTGDPDEHAAEQHDTDLRVVPATPDDPAAIAADRRHAARDRAAAAEERRAAALDRAQAAEYLQRTYRDDLTGALRREVGRDRIAQEIDRAHRAHGDLIVAFFDVDGLKRVNDEQGHAAGDHLLKTVGQSLREGLRSYDVVVRYGGDEFVCAMPNASGSEANRRFIEVHETLHRLHPGGRVSVGMAALEDGDTVDDVIERADLDLYAGRQQLHQVVALPEASVGSAQSGETRSS
jgi:diguanylate cyclase (GGDEF)-like protein